MVMDKTTELNNSYFRDISREDVLQMRNTLIHILRNMEMDIDEYMGSKYENPFYTHLHIAPLKEGYETVSRRATDDDDEENEEI